MQTVINLLGAVPIAANKPLVAGGILALFFASVAAGAYCASRMLRAKELG